MVGGLALGVTAATALALGGPAGAQEEPNFIELQGSLSPEVAAPGEGITASSVEHCTVEGEAGELFWIVVAAGAYEAAEQEGFEPVGADGSWSVGFDAPSEPGDYEFFGYCFPGELPAEEEQELEEELMAQADELTERDVPAEELSFDVEAYYLPFSVDAGDGDGDGGEPQVPEPEQPAPPVAEPAVAVPGDPTYTG